MAKRNGGKALREALFAGGIEERVEVNQRHLIDKILARYSSEFTLFRELIQNANDAGATEVAVVLSAPNYQRIKPHALPNDTDSPSASASSSAASAASSIVSIFKLGWNALQQPLPEDLDATDAQAIAEKPGDSNGENAEAMLGKCAVAELEIRNNGRQFSEADWKRIKSIAEGNPNSESCGMFGVGFYSVFSIAEEPIVRSGNDALVFHWRGDGLVTTRRKLDELREGEGEGSEKKEGEGEKEVDEGSKEKKEIVNRKDWVSFILEAREPMPFDLDDLSRFLVKTVAFTTKVRVVRLIVNNEPLLCVSKSTPSSNSDAEQTNQALRNEVIPVPALMPHDITSRFKAGQGYMSIKSMMVQDIEVDIWRLAGSGEARTKVAMKQVEARVDVHWNLVPEYLENMKRILKKTPPSSTTVLLLYNSKGGGPKDSLLGNNRQRKKNKRNNRNNNNNNKQAQTELDGTAVNPSPYSFFSFLGAQQQQPAARQQVTNDDDDDDNYERRLTADLYPCPDNGHVFIGFSTHQTTGSGYHLAAQLIPTVERENIDFQDVYISNWNCTLLSAAGRVARLFHEYSLTQIQQKRHHLLKWANEAPNATLSAEELALKAEAQKAEEEVVALLKAHSFTESHPSQNVAKLLFQYFFAPPTVSDKSAAHLLVPCATGGLIDSSKARLPFMGMEEFITSPTAGLVPVESGGQPFSVIPKHILAKAPRFFQQLERFNIVRPIAMLDMLQHLRTRTVSLEEWGRLLKWFQSNEVQQELFPQKKGSQKQVRRFLSSVTVSVPKREDEDEQTLAATMTTPKGKETEKDAKTFICQNLDSVNYFLPKNKLQVGIPVPPSTCLPEISDMCNNRGMLKDVFLWKELTFLEWWTYMTSTQAPLSQSVSQPVRKGRGGQQTQRPLLLEHYITSPQYNMKLLRYIGTVYPTLEETQRAQVLSFLETRAVFPIQEETDPKTAKLYKASDIYFPQVNLFEDIKHIRGDVLQAIPNKAFLKALGVRENVELRLVLDRLEVLKWDVRDLLTFLAKEQQSFTTNDWNLLRNASFLQGIVYTPKAPEAEIEKLPEQPAIALPAGAAAMGLTNSTNNPPRVQPPRAARSATQKGESAAVQLEGKVLPGTKKPFELFFPHAALKELSLPVLYWPDAHELDARSRQAVLLKRIGLVDHPTFDSLISIAANPAMTAVVLTYMEKHMEELLKREPKFKISDVNTPFLPALRPYVSRTAKLRGSMALLGKTSNEEIVASPKECFIQSSPFGFAYIAPRWVALAKKLGLPDHPPLAVLLSMMISDPPQDVQEGQLIFTYFFSRLSEFEGHHFAQLRKARFIPVSSIAVGKGGDEHFIHMGVDEVLVVAKQKRVRQQQQQHAKKEAEDDEEVMMGDEEQVDLFLWVDFGDKANVFLHSCSVAHHANPEHWARALLSRYKIYLQKHGVKEYLQLLYHFAHVFTRIAPASPIIKSLQTTPFCLGVMFEGDAELATNSKTVEKTTDDSDEEFMKPRKEIAVLRCAKECYLIDNERYQFLFNPPRVPSVMSMAEAQASTPKTGATTLEAMYEALGSTWITKSVRHTSTPKGKAREDAERAVKLKERLVERTPLLVHTMQGKRRLNALPQAERVIKTMRIAAVAEINRVLKFGDLQVVEKASVSVKKETVESKTVVMYIAERGGEIDWFDVGTEVAHLLYSKTGHDDALLAAMLLQTPLPTLRRKGWPVDRLLQNKIASADAPAYKQPPAVDEQQPDQSPARTPQGKNDRGKNLPLGAKEQELVASPAAQAASQPKTPNKGNAIVPQASTPNKQLQGPSPPPPQIAPQSLWQRVTNYWAPPSPPSTPTPVPTALSPQGKTPDPDVLKMKGGQERTEHHAPVGPVSGTEHQMAMDSAMAQALSTLSQFGGAKQLHQEASRQESVHYSCEQLPQQNLTLLDRFEDVPLYLQEGAQLSQRHMQAASEFGGLLKDLSTVFGVGHQSVVMFYDYNGSRIAFNRDRTLYFNLRMFVDLRHRRSSPEACVFWYLTACHELAHNNVSVHNEEHESLLTWFAYRYMMPLMQHVHHLQREATQ